MGGEAVKRVYVCVCNMKEERRANGTEVEVGSSWTPSRAREDDAFAFTPRAGSGGRTGQNWGTRGQTDAHRWGEERRQEGTPQLKDKRRWECPHPPSPALGEPLFLWYWEQIELR